MDSAFVAERTGALLVGSASTANIGRGHGLANDRVGKRVVVIAIDDGSLSTNGALWGVIKTRTIATTIVKALGPDDLAAVVFTEHAKTAQNFTSDRRLLLAAIDTAPLFPAPISGDPADPLQNRRGSCPCGVCSIETLERVAEGLVPLRQQRKTIFYISPGVEVSASMSPFETLPSPFSTFQDGCETQKHDALMDTFRRAQLANVTIPRWIQTDSEPRAGSPIPISCGRSPRTPAAAPWSTTTIRSSRSVDCSPRAVPYYLLGFEPAPHKADGGFHRIQVKVAGRDAQVRARSGYFAENAKERKTPRTETASLDDAIGGLVAKSEVPLQVSVAPFADGRGKGALAIALSVTEPARPAERNAAATAGSKPATDVDVLATVLDSQGRISGSRRLTLRLGLNRASGRDLHYENPSATARLPRPLRSAGSPCGRARLARAASTRLSTCLISPAHLCPFRGSSWRRARPDLRRRPTRTPISFRSYHGEAGLQAHRSSHRFRARLPGRPPTPRLGDRRGTHRRRGQPGGAQQRNAPRRAVVWRIALGRLPAGSTGRSARTRLLPPHRQDLGRVRCSPAQPELSDSVGPSSTHQRANVRSTRTANLSPSYPLGPVAPARDAALGNST